MRPLCRRVTCGSQNRFTPSTALWQYFVLPCRPTPYQQRSSLTSSTAQTSNYSSPPHFPSLPGPKDSVDDLAGETSTSASTIDSPSENSIPPSGVGLNITYSIFKPQRNKNAKINDYPDPEGFVRDTKIRVEKGEDYVGVNIRPRQAEVPVRERDWPWVVPPNAWMPAPERLSLEMENFHNYLKPTQLESIARKAFVAEIQERVRRRLPDVELEIFGSERTGLAFATSDLDLRLMHKKDADSSGQDSVKPPSPHERKSLLEDLTKLYYELKPAYAVCDLRYARYPLIDLWDIKSGLEAQIVLSNDTSLSRKYIHKYIDEYPHIPKIYSVVKCLFDIRGLSDVYNGGIGAYSIFMMIVAALRHNPPAKPHPAHGLWSFLEFWRDVDYSKGISIEPVEFFDKKSQPVMTEKVKAQQEGKGTAPLPLYMLCLRDPADATNDLGRKGVCIKHVQATLHKVHNFLRRDCKFNTRPCLLEKVVGEVYALNVLRRKKLESYARHLEQHLPEGVESDSQSTSGKTSISARNGTQTPISQKTEEQEWGAMIASNLGMPSVEEVAKEKAQNPEGQNSGKTTEVHSTDLKGTSEHPLPSEPQEQSSASPPSLSDGQSGTK
ncbi:hypothetical protein BCR34DRAFT_481184 [Clohesyomyces aquaticus]|uniref:Poly(A) RNA polymerase mitochondrial-like central palm domain-containing protein n=1 Tax=Clohesyomyces aquaticus TaxID=1231657 RepID=A0A1Y1ZSQ4_9PLEO|nr:hypothetical protein BCR34DRAFT_481184 [Clohesyomyces aquaticus]